MIAVAVVLGSVLACALLGGVALRCAALARQVRTRDSAPDRAAADAMRALLDATRTSSDAVLGVLDRNVRRLDAGLDTMMVFAASAGELRCVYASGARAEHFRRCSLRRDDLRQLPARAAHAGCRAAVSHDARAILPTDRAALAVPMLDARGLLAVAYVSSSDPRALDPNRCDRSGGRLCRDAVRARARTRSRSRRCDLRRADRRADAARVSAPPARRTRQSVGDRRADRPRSGSSTPIVSRA